MNKKKEFLWYIAPDKGIKASEKSENKMISCLVDGPKTDLTSIDENNKRIQKSLDLIQGNLLERVSQYGETLF